MAKTFGIYNYTIEVSYCCRGRDRYGNIYLGFDKSSGVPMLIKEIPNELMMSCGLQAKLTNEISTNMRLNHPNILRVYGFEIADQYTYVIWEYGIIENLRDLFDSMTRINEIQVKQYTKVMIDAMIYSHRQNIDHAELRPENVLFGENRILKLAYFGPVTRIHLMKCRATPSCLPPEVYEDGQRITEKIDSFALGCLVFMMLTHRHPFASDMDTTRDDVLNKIACSKIVYPGEYEQNSVVSDFVSRLLDPSVTRRYSLYVALNDEWLSDA